MLFQIAGRLQCAKNGFKQVQIAYLAVISTLASYTLSMQIRLLHCPGLAIKQGLSPLTLGLVIPISIVMFNNFHIQSVKIQLKTLKLQ